MLDPMDYGYDAINNQKTKSLMKKIEFVHGGSEYDRNYPDGIPTRVKIFTSQNKEIDSNMVMYPGGHARNTTVDLNNVLDHKFKLLGNLALGSKALN
jgi:2-methylcitrate dehydratase